jgi:tRNA modification GTPase
MNKTIVALATPPGISGLAVIRLSGDEAFTIADKSFIGKTKLSEGKSHTIHYGIFKFEAQLIDTVTAAIFIEPNSYTGENSVEISCHGGILVAEEIIDALISNGAVLAEPGEFTKRAFLNGKLDLTQVEAVADIIHAASVPASQTAARQLTGEFTTRLNSFRQQLLDIAGLLELELDFAEEDIELIQKQDIEKKIENTLNFCIELSESFRAAEVLRSGYFVAIAGFPNSGKSTLFNKLLQRKRAIVSEIPGTTRDYLEETIYLNGIGIKLIDTAGLRHTEDEIEIEGIKFAESILKQSNLILILNDISISPDHSKILFDKLKTQFPDSPSIIVQNKTDKIDFEYKSQSVNKLEILISAKHNIGLDELKTFIESEARKDTNRIKDILINQRHSALLKEAASALNSSLNSLKTGMENEIISIDIRRAAKTLGEITGESWSEELLNNIFSRFCIGK